VLLIRNRLRQSLDVGTTKEAKRLGPGEVWKASGEPTPQLRNLAARGRVVVEILADYEPWPADLFVVLTDSEWHSIANVLA